MTRFEAGNTHWKTALERRPRFRRSQAEWAEIRALYLAGATVRALVERFGGSESGIRTHLRRRGCLRKDQAALACPLEARALGDRVREMSGCEADAPVRALGEEASLAEAARAAARTAIRMLREAEPTRSYTYARLAGTLERLARGAAGGGDGGGGEGEGERDGTERGRRAALDFLRREALAG
jgi:hypothetical protein